MKRSLALLCSAALVLALFAGCSGKNVTSSSTADESTSASQSEAADFVPGTRTETSYTSEWLGLSYTLGADMVMASDDELQKMMQAGTEAVYDDSETGQQMLDAANATTAYDMMAVRTDGGANVIILAEKLPLAGFSVDQYITAFKGQLSKTNLNTTFGEPTDDVLAEMPFTRLDSTTTVNNVTYNQSYFLKKVGGRMAVIIFTYTDTASLEAMQSGFKAL